jgi:hypothetical protein
MAVNINVCAASCGVRTGRNDGGQHQRLRGKLRGADGQAGIARPHGRHSDQQRSSDRDSGD